MHAAPLLSGTISGADLKKAIRLLSQRRAATVKPVPPVCGSPSAQAGISVDWSP